MEKPAELDIDTGQLGTNQVTPRQSCYRCHRPTFLCVCDSIPRVNNRTGVFVLQHPKERLHPFGTARLLRLGLANIDTEVFAPRDNLPARFASTLPAHTALLYPSADARELGSLAPLQRPANLLVIDGTWHHAKALYRACPWLSCMPHVSLTPTVPSRYRIRREPAAHCISTVEAVVQALQILEPDTDALDGLISAFTAMIDNHLRLRQSSKPNPYQRRRRPTKPAIGPALAQDNLVVVYAEYVRQKHQRKLAAWAAYRCSTGEQFWALLQPHVSGVEARHLQRMGIAPTHIAQAQSLEALQHSWRDFIKPSDQVVAWNQSTLDLLQQFPPPLPAATMLKAVYCNITRAPASHLEAIVKHLHLQPPNICAPGRAGSRLGAAVAVLGHLQKNYPPV